MAQIYLAHKKILKEADVCLTDKEKEIIKSFDVRLTANRVALFLFDVTPSKSGLIVPFSGDKGANPDKRTRPGQIDPKFFPCDPQTAVVVSVGEDVEGLKKGDLIYLDSGHSGADSMMVNGNVYAIIRYNQISAVGENLL